MTTLFGENYPEKEEKRTRTANNKRRTKTRTRTTNDEQHANRHRISNVGCTRE